VHGFLEGVLWESVSAVAVKISTAKGAVKLKGLFPMTIAESFTAALGAEALAYCGGATARWRTREQVKARGLQRQRIKPRVTWNGT
jgi:hypothetical protein